MDGTRAKRLFVECPDGYRWIVSGGYRIKTGRFAGPSPYWPYQNQALRPEGTNGGWVVSVRRLLAGAWQLTVTVECMRSPLSR